MTTYLIDTSIWIDLAENRKGFLGEPHDEYASELFFKIIKDGSKIAITDTLLKELQKRYSDQDILGMFNIFEGKIERIISNERQNTEANLIAKERNLPKGDSLFAIIARDYNLILVARDKHFNQLLDITTYSKAEELLS